MLGKCFATEVLPSLLWDGKHSLFSFVRLLALCWDGVTMLVSNALRTPVSSYCIG